eukprot:1157619-Pelagomonas_calceolata.AAC.10
MHTPMIVLQCPSTPHPLHTLPPNPRSRASDARKCASTHVPESISKTSEAGWGQQGLQFGAQEFGGGHAHKGSHVPSGKGDDALPVAHLVQTWTHIHTQKRWRWAAVGGHCSRSAVA